MYNKLIGTYDFGGYEITVRKSSINGMYELIAWVNSMGEEYREHMLSDTLDDDVFKKFINKIEGGK